MRFDKPVLAIDVGGGTQDIFLFQPGQPVENCVQMVLPSQTQVIARQISEITRRRKDLFLTGSLMGGGASSSAVRKHLAAGCRVYANPNAAKTLNDDLDKVRAMGVIITENPPENCISVTMGDINLPALTAALKPFAVELPEHIAVAVQDHGESLGISNRLFRFQHWQRFMEEVGGDIRGLLYKEIPSYLTRMLAVKAAVPHAYLADTGTAAIWGALEDPQVDDRRAEGVILLNVGNQHTVGVLLKGWQVYGLFEHHTGLLNPVKLIDYVNRLRCGVLTHAEVYQDGGHGCYISPHYSPAQGFSLVAVTGPKRAMSQEAGYYLAVPHGNMMLAGAFGLVAALAAQQRNRQEQ
ncbi:MAG: DUF1786 domain-containing protein [Bacillota bacterium]